MQEILTNNDENMIAEITSVSPETESVANFVESSGIRKLELEFDIFRLREAMMDCLQRQGYMGNMQDKGFAALPLTRLPGVDHCNDNDLSGRFWTRVDDSYIEVSREDPVDEAAFSEFNPLFKGSYFEWVHEQLCKRFTIGRMRLISKSVYNCNSWHRDPEPRIHIPIITNPGSLFIVNHQVTHLPADGNDRDRGHTLSRRQESECVIIEDYSINSESKLTRPASNIHLSQYI